MKIQKELQEKYDSFYSDETERWRRIGAIGKAQNIISLAKGSSFEQIVEIGAGDGNILSVLNDRGFCKRMTAVEISKSAIEQIKKKKIESITDIIQFDGYSLPFNDNQFDLAICSHVIEHVEYPRKLLSEIKRISKKQIFEIPIDFSFKVDKKYSHFQSYGHINIYTPSLFKFLLYSTGFKAIKDKYSLYNREVIDFIYKKSPLKYAIVLIKRLIWKSVPLLMKIKPNTYTVLTE